MQTCECCDGSANVIVRGVNSSPAPVSIRNAFCTEKDIFKKFLRPFETSNIIKTTSLIGRVSQLASQMNINLGRTKEYLKVSKMLAPFTFMQAIDDLVFGRQKLDFRLDNTFNFSFVKKSCEFYQAVTYLSKSAFLNRFKKFMFVLGNITSIGLDVNILYNLSQKYCDSSTEKNNEEVVVELLRIFCDITCRTLVLGLIVVSDSVKFIIDLAAITSLIIEYLYIDHSGIDENSLIYGPGCPCC
tara:strand:+ start:367 stop:1095 length:729 start_codon:yes stop_codon:yes gene_type:complete